MGPHHLNRIHGTGRCVYPHEELCFHDKLVARYYPVHIQSHGCIMGHVTLVLLISDSVGPVHHTEVIALEVLTWNPLEQTYEFEC